MEVFYLYILMMSLILFGLHAGDFCFGVVDTPRYGHLDYRWTLCSFANGSILIRYFPFALVVWSCRSGSTSLHDKRGP